MIKNVYALRYSNAIDIFMLNKKILRVLSMYDIIIYILLHFPDYMDIHLCKN